MNDFEEVPEGLIINPDAAAKRVMIGCPMTGLVRSESIMARYGQVYPCNWSVAQQHYNLPQVSPLGYLVADARNVIVSNFIKEGFEWLWFIDHDVILPGDATIKVNERVIQGDVPVWSGLYFTKSVPAEPLIYRGRGTGYYANWKMGDEVWVDGLPMGCTLIHKSILQVLYDESEEYVVGGQTVRKVFETPLKVWYSPEKDAWKTQVGTEDLAWCSRVIKDGVLKKAGWKKYQRRKYPFMIDTSLFCFHIDFNGVSYPSIGEHKFFMKDK
jgi:hypothetical protein